MGVPPAQRRFNSTPQPFMQDGVKKKPKNYKASEFKAFLPATTICEIATSLGAKPGPK